MHSTSRPRSERQERLQGQTCVGVMDAFGPADLYSETAAGEGMFWRGRAEFSIPGCRRIGSASSIPPTLPDGSC